MSLGEEVSNTNQGKSSNDAEAAHAYHFTEQFDHDCSKSLHPVHYYKDIFNKEHDTNIKQWIENSLQKLHGQVKSCDNLTVLSSVKSHLSTAMAVMDAKGHMEQLQHDSLKPICNLPPNASHQKQLSFYSTKQKPKKLRDGVSLQLVKQLMY